jgi:hypothetical protein
MAEPVESYEETIARLVRTRAAAAAERARAHEWYARQCAAAQEAVGGAANQVAAAREALASAQAAVDMTDTEAARIWQILAVRLGPRAVARLGPVPGPAQRPPTARAGRLLEQARELLDEVEPSRPRRRPQVVLGLLAVLLLVAAAAVAGALLR